jgi:2'-5' RNA ligase
MKLKGTTIPGIAIYEYFLMITIPDRIQEMVLRLREEFSEQFKNDYSIKGRPGVALAHFLQYEMKQAGILTRLQTIASLTQPFDICLGGFGSFPTHSIFIEPTIHAAVYELVSVINKDVKRSLQLNAETKPMIILHPHVGIVRKLSPQLYERSWPGYQHRSFDETFHTKDMILLRRPLGTKTWQRVYTLEFQGLKPPSVQATLF